MTLLLSYVLFTKPLTEQHGTGLLLIAMGIVLKMLPDSGGGPQKRVPVKRHENQDDEEQGIAKLRLQIGNEDGNEEKKALV